MDSKKNELRRSESCMNDSSSAHQFALFLEAPHAFQVGQTVTLEDAQLVSRITSVLRLRRKETVVLFTLIRTIKK